MTERRKVYLLAGVASIMLYFVGVFTGAVILGYTESRTSQEFASLHDEVQGYGKDLESIELELLYLASGQGELGCKFITTSLNRVQNDLDYFWRNLPQKLEIYERENSPDPEYEALKSEYMGISLKAWLLSLSVREKCGKDTFPILYFYSRDCDNSIEQGSILDHLRDSHEILVYTIDLNLDSDAVSMVREAYGIERAPALIIGEDAYQGLVPEERLEEIVEKGSI
jgi:hypothetical protein